MLSLIRIESPDRASDGSCSAMIDSDSESPNLQVPALKLEKLRRVRSPLKRSRNISPDKCSTERIPGYRKSVERIRNARSPVKKPTAT